MSLKILMLCYLDPYWDKRKSIFDHLYSFKYYGKKAKFHYFDVYAIKSIPDYLTKFPYDGVILHYTLLGMRWSYKTFPQFFKTIKKIKQIPGVKVAIPQDEYAHTQELWKMFKDFGVQTVFTLVDKSSYNMLYPLNKTGLKRRITVYAGYVDEITLKKIEGWPKSKDSRPIDIGYRARYLPFWLGRYGQKKAELGRVVKEYCKKYTNLKIDISSDYKDVLEGDDWIKFLLRCKAALGCEGGATLMDPDGSIRRCVENYVNKKPLASFDEVERYCFPKLDPKLNYLAVTPRHFEYAMTKTCQILLEGNYSGILRPNYHYIPLKLDYSNLKEVISQVQDDEYRNWLVENTYRDIILSGKYTYRVFVERVIKEIKRLNQIYGKRQLEKRYSLKDSLTNSIKSYQLYWIVLLIKIETSLVHLRKRLIVWRHYLVRYRGKLLYRFFCLTSLRFKFYNFVKNFLKL